MRILLATSVAMGIVSAMLVSTSPEAAAQTIVEFAIPTSNSSPTEITAGPDGSMWFTEQNANKIGRISLAGAIQDWVLPTANGGPQGIVAGPDGNLWFTETQSGKIGKISTIGNITEYAIATSNSQPLAITVGSDGNLWFTEQSGNKIGRITTGGGIVEFALPTAASMPTGIRPGSDGALWFTEAGTNKLGRIATGGLISEFPASNPNSNASLRFISPFPDGELIFTEAGTDQLGVINTSGQIEGYASYPSAGAGAYYLAIGPDGGIWFTEPNVNKIARIKIGAGAPTFQEFAVPTAASGLATLSAGPDGNLWFTEQNTNKIGRLTPPSSGSPLVAAVLPGSRSVQVGRQATAFATIINGGAANLDGCGIVALTPVAASLSFQTTNPATNAPVGAANTRVSIPAQGSQTFTFGLTPGGAQAPENIAIGFACAGADPVQPISGVNTFLYGASVTATPDIIALVATSSGDGILDLDSNGGGAFAIATSNVGATGQITAIVDTGAAQLNANFLICQTNPTTGKCILPASSAAYGPVFINANDTPTYSIFVTSSGSIPFLPATNRIFIRFKDSNNVVRGLISVAVRTQ